MNSLTQIMDQLPFSVKARKEVYHHPLLPVGHPARSEDGVCGDFVKAIGEQKVLATYNDNKDHAVSMFDVSTKFNFSTFSSQNIICKNSYDNEKIYNIKLAKQLPLLGHFVSFKRTTDRSEENIQRFGIKGINLKNLLEMGFDRSLVEKAVDNVDSDFEAALAFCYSRGVMKPPTQGVIEQILVENITIKPDSNSVNLKPGSNIEDVFCSSTVLIVAVVLSVVLAVVLQQYTVITNH